MTRRLRNALLTLAMVSAFSPLGFAGPPTWTTGFDVDTGAITDIAAANGVAYAGTYNGVFLSDDGHNWREAGLQSRAIISVVIDTAGEAVYAIETRDSVWGYLWVSVDGGAHWKASDPGILVNTLVADPREPNRVWAGTSIQGALRTSVDRGEHWERVETHPSLHGIAQLLFDLHDGTMYAQGYENDLFAKASGGEWQRAGYPVAGIVSIIAGEATPGLLHAVTPRGFCKSTDHAVTWTCPAGSPTSWGVLAEVPADDSDLGLPPRLLWTDGVVIMTSDDGGFVWSAVSDVPEGAYINTLAVDAPRRRAFAGTSTGALRSDDRGTSWKVASKGLRAAVINAVAAGPDFLLAGRASDLFSSTDHGESWSTEEPPADPFDIGEIAIDPKTATAYVYGYTSLFRKRPGEAWTTQGTLSAPMSAFAIDPGSPDSVWVATWDDVRHSSDGGQTWSPTTLSAFIYSLVVDPTRPGRIYAGSYFELDSSYNYYPVGGTVYRSDDSGETWTKGSDVHSIVVKLAFDPFDPDRLYAGTYNNGVVSTLDGGKTWRFPSSVPPGGLAALVVDPVRRDTLYAGTPRGVYRSRDRGRSWLPFDDGLPEIYVSSLAISPDGRFLHAATAGAGVYDLALEDEAAPGPCVSGPARLCLLGNRFQLELTAPHKGTGEPEPGAAHALNDRAGYFGIPSFTGDETLPEVTVKMLPDGAFGIDGFPFLYASMTGARFTLVVTDTFDGRQSAYHGDSLAFCGGNDLVALDASKASHLDKWSPAPAPEALSLLGGRFSVSLEARTHDGRSAAGVPFASADRYGFFSLPGITGDAALPELVVKMLDGRGTNQAFWVFHGSLTGLDYTLTVRDEQTGETRTYESGVSFCGTGDIQAFPE